MWEAQPRLRALLLSSVFTLLFLLLFKPVVTEPIEWSGISRYISWDVLDAIALVLSVVVLIIYVARMRFDVFGVLVLALFAITALATFVNKGDLGFWAMESVPCVAAALVVGVGWRYCHEHMVMGAMIASMIYLGLNLLFLLLRGELASMGSLDVLFFGYRNITFRVGIPAFGCSLVLDSFKSKKPSIRSWCIFLLALFELVVAYSATSVCALLAMGLVVLLSRVVKLRRVCNGLTFFCLYLMSFVGIVVLRLQVYLGFIIENILGRTASFTGRTDIWDAAFGLLGGTHGLLGYGQSYIWNAIVLNGMPFQHAHNELLHFALLGGVVAVLIYIALLAVVAVGLFRVRGDFGSGVLAATLFAYFIIGLAEVTFFPSSFFMLAVMFYYARGKREQLGPAD